MYGARDTKKPVAYCRIIDYVEHCGPEGERLKDLFQFTCSMRLLSSLHGKSGVTLMWPTVKVIGEIEDAVYKGDEASIFKAQQRLRAHVLCNVYNEKNPFIVDKQAVNCLVPSRGVKVKEASSKTVKFDKSANSDPATAELDTAFKVVTDPQNPRVLLSVWRMKSGEMPIDGPEASVPKPTKKGGDVRAVHDQESKNYRCGIIATIEKQYAAQEGKVDVYGKYYASLYNHLETSHPDVLLEVVIPLTSCTPIDLYLILEPYSSSHLIAHSIIKEWWEEHKGSDLQNKAEVCKKIISVLTEGHHRTTAGLYDPAKRVAMLKLVNESRSKLLNAICSDFKNCVKAYETEYANLWHAADSFLPGAILRLYSNPAVKIAHDDLRYVASMLFTKLATQWDAATFEQLKSDIKHSLCSQKAVLVHASTVKYTIDGGRELQPQIYAFCASDYLWFFPHTMADSEAAAKGMKILNMQPETGRKGLWRDLVYALCRPTCASTALDNQTPLGEAHRELYNALRDLMEQDSATVTAEAERVLAKYNTRPL